MLKNKKIPKVGIGGPVGSGKTRLIERVVPILVLFTTADHIAVRSSVKALDDHMGGEGGGGTYGTYSRNAHLWSVD